MNLVYSKEINVKYDVDVFVAGGGPAGVAAAVSCARDGKNVFLAESFSAFGGAASTMIVPAFMPFGDKVNFLAGGIGREVYDRIKNESPERFATYCPDSIPVETLKLIYDDMVEKAGVKFQFHTNVTDVISNNGKVEYVICSAKGETFAVKAKVFIDCTGDGDLCDYAGAEYEYGDENGKVMATTLCGIWSGVNWSKKIAPDRRRLEDAFKDKVFTNEDRHLPGMWSLVAQSDENIPDGVGGSNAGHIYDIDARFAESLTQGVMKGRKQLQEYRKYYKEYLDGFETIELLMSAPYLGIRESRRITCDYRMKLEDFINRADFDDEIGRYNYCVDVHSSTNDKAGYEKFAKDHKSLRYQQGESYGIPYRTITVKGFDNLLVAGRCVCSDRYMQSSIRVMPGCFITGQAAGLAASITCESEKIDIRGFNVKELQSRLRKIGAFMRD